LRESAEAVLRNACRCESILTSLLSYGRAHVSQFVRVDVNELIEKSLSLAECSRSLEKINIQELQREADALLLSFLERAIERKIKETLEKFLKTLLAKPRLPALLKELLDRGLINRDGRLAEGATIMDLISGRYSGLFKKVVSEELVNEALVIKETIKICCRGQEEEYRSLIDRALIEKGVLEITLESIWNRRNPQGRKP